MTSRSGRRREWKPLPSLSLSLFSLTLTLTLLLAPLPTALCHLYVSIHHMMTAAPATSSSSTSSSAIQLIQICKLCPSPEREGSIIHGLKAKYGVKEYQITGEVIFCVPNYGEVKKFVNRRQLKGKIGLVFRGEVSLYDKVIHAQGAGVLALIIIDDGQCDDGFVFCGKRIGGVHEGGFSASDSTDLWHQVNIPVFLVTQSAGKKLQKMIDYEVVDSPEWGTQFYPILDDDEL